METIYKAYTKEVGGKVFYFVKKYSAFPEYENIPSVLESMGMHTNLYKACAIAGIDDERVISGFLNELHIMPDSARVIHMHRVKAMTTSLIKNTQQALLRLGIAGIN